MNQLNMFKLYLVRLRMNNHLNAKAKSYCAASARIEMMKDFMSSFIGRTNSSVGLGSNDSLQTKVHLEIDRDHWALSSITSHPNLGLQDRPNLYRFRVRLG